MESSEKSMPENNTSKSAYFITAVLFAIVGYIALGAFIALPMKYIFFDYFARIGWPTDFSYMTTIMLILGLRMLYAVATFVPKVNVQSPNNK